MGSTEGVARTNGLRAVEAALDHTLDRAGIAPELSGGPPRTLKTAIVGGEMLLQRLAKLEETVARVATLVGGKVPAAARVELPEQSSSLMDRLNDLNDAAHARVSDMENSFAAVCRALGAEE